MSAKESKESVAELREEYERSVAANAQLAAKVEAMKKGVDGLADKGR